MKVYLSSNLAGCFAFDQKGKLVDYRFFPKNPEEIASRLEAGKSREEEELAGKLLDNGYEVVSDRRITGTNFQQDHPGRKFLQESFRKLAIDLKWVSSGTELNEILSKVQVLRTKGKRAGRDRIIMISIGILEELDKDLNNFSERLREWVGLGNPGLPREIQSNEKFAEAAMSEGIDFSPEDLDAVRQFAGSVRNLFQARKSLQQFLEKACQEVIPNTSAVAGEILAARLLAQAGGLEKLSRMPSSTIQVLGAEKALFRHLKDKEFKAPKYGVLFAHPLIQKATKEKRGKIARLISAKISLASKTDYFSKTDKGASLKNELEKDVELALR